MINIADEPMFSIGCIQAQNCHTNRCPTGVATKNRWLTRGLDVPSKPDRVADCIEALRRDVFKTSQAAGLAHPGLITVDDLEVADCNRHVVTLGFGPTLAPMGN